MNYTIELVSPSVAYRDSFLEALSQFHAPSDRDAWVYLGDAEDLTYPAREFADYVQSLQRRQTAPPPGFVCDTTYWAVHAGQVVGRISIRHELNEFLEKIGGHIGYITRLDARGKGVASSMLRLLLETERARSIGRLLLTCDESNAASEKTILKNGGVFAGLLPIAEGKPSKKHFWIDLTGHPK